MAASGAKAGPQRDTTSLSPVASQLELRIARRAAPGKVDPQAVALQPSMTAALNLSMNLSGLSDGEICGALGIDKGNWSRIRSGQSSFPHDLLLHLMTLCGNTVPLQWLAERAGFELKPLRSELEEQLDAERTARLEAERENALLKRLFAETRR